MSAEIIASVSGILIMKVVPAPRRHIQRAVTEFAQQRLAGMSKSVKARQTNEAASAFNAVKQKEDVVPRRLVVRAALEPDQFDVDHIQAFAGSARNSLSGSPMACFHNT